MQSRRVSRNLAIGLLILLVAFLVVRDSYAAETFITGMCAHIMSRPDLATRSLPYLERLGVRSVRNDAPWAKVELKRGELQIPAEWDQVVDTLLSHHIEPLLILDYGNPLYEKGDKPTSPEAIRAFKYYVRFVAQHFRGRVHYYEVWNEWDAATGATTPGTPESYAELLRAVYPALKAQDPGIVVLGGSVTSEGLRGDRHLHLLTKLGMRQTWFQRLLATSALHYMDGLSVHPYNFMLSDERATPEAWLSWVGEIEAELRNANQGRDVPLYVTEMGWPDYNGRGGVAEKTAASYRTRTYILARSIPYLKGIWWYQLQDEAWDPADKEQHFGVLRPDFSLKPVFKRWEARFRATHRVM